MIFKYIILAILFCLISANISNEVEFLSDSIPESTISNGNLSIGGYYQSWSAKWATKGSDHTLAQIPSYVSYILVSFATPSMSYTRGQNTFSGTGLQFSCEFPTVKEAIAIAHQNNPNQKFILSVGGATYQWTNPNYEGIAALMTDLGLDGVDIDFENDPSCTGVDSDSLSCSTDSLLIEIINNLRAALPTGKLLTAAVFSVGAYGTPSFPMSRYLPGSGHTGMWVNPIKQAGSKLDEIFVMSYDASPVYNPTEAFNAYQSIFRGRIHIGLEVPPEAWGGYVLTVEDALKFANHAKNNNGHGVFIWSFQKNAWGTPTANTFIGPICSLFGHSNCNQQIPLN